MTKPNLIFKGFPKGSKEIVDDNFGISFLLEKISIHVDNILYIQDSGDENKTDFIIKQSPEFRPGISWQEGHIVQSLNRFLDILNEDKKEVA